MPCLLVNHGAVGGFIHQLVELAGIGHLDFEQPAIMGPVGGDAGQIVKQCVIDLGDLTASRAVDVGGGLYRFEHRDGVALADRRASLGKLDEDDVAKLFDSVA